MLMFLQVFFRTNHFIICYGLLPIPSNHSNFRQLHMRSLYNQRRRPQLLIIPYPNLLRHWLLIYNIINLNYQLLLNIITLLIIYPIHIIIDKICQYMRRWIRHIQTMIYQTIYSMWLLFCVWFWFTISGIVIEMIVYWWPHYQIVQ